MLPGAAAATQATVSVEPVATTAPISDNYVGLGLELPTIPQWTGAGSQVDRILVNLIRNLGASPVIRVGGVSTDRSWWPVPGMTRPLGVTYDLGQKWLAATKTLVDATNAKLIMGINLEADSVPIAQSEAQHIVAGLGSEHIDVFEVGNEPELYEIYPWYKLAADDLIIPWYSTKPGTPVFSRPPGYGVGAYTADFTQFRLGLRGDRLAGFDSGSQWWLSQLPTFLSAEPGLSMITFHRYGLNGCQKNRAARNYTSIPNLLGTFASRGIMAGVPLAVAQAHAAHAAFRIDEMNSAYCDGVPGVSNTFASALWLLDTLFEMRSDGIDGVNLHSFPGAASALFDFGHVRGKWAAVVHPEYYAMLMFERAAPAGSRLLKLSATSIGSLRAWATTSATKGIHVVLINDNLSHAETVHVRLPLKHAMRPVVTALKSPAAASTIKVTLGGLSYGAVTYTGTLTHVPARDWSLPTGLPYALIPPGHHAAPDVRAHAAAVERHGVRVNGDTYTITVPPASAVLLNWQASLPGVH